MITDLASPYTMEEPPTSTGRVLLARAFAHWCTLHHGHDAREIADAFDGKGEGAPEVRREVAHAARLLGELIAAGRMRTVARPMGGGAPSPIKAGDWELDDFRPRFARSAFDPARPFDPSAAPTHWIFVELDDFNELVEASCADVVPMGARPTRRTEPQQAIADVPPPVRTEDRHVRMPEIKRRTGMSASTVYRRIDQGRFPRQIPMFGGNIAAWWESEVADWIASPR